MTHTEPEQRRSRRGWAIRTEPTTTPAGTHDHGQKNGPLFLAFFCIVGLFVVNAGLIWFILARGEARDAAELRMREQIRSGYCELLDAFPADPLLDTVRDRFGCGPGIPVEDLPPDVQENLNNRNLPPLALEPVPLPPGVEAVPEGTFPGGAVMPDPNQPVPEPYFPTPGEPEPPATVPYPPGFPPPDPVQPTAGPATPPLIDLGPITDPVCEFTSICL